MCCKKQKKEKEKLELGSLAFNQEGSGPASWAEHRWHNEKVYTYPATQSIFDDIFLFIQDYILPGYLPDSSVLSLSDNVITLGSCFAAELRRFLNLVGFSSNSLWIPSGLNNTFAIHDFISWCITGCQTSFGYRYDRAQNGFIEEWEPAGEREIYLQSIQHAGAFVFTLGLAEVWQDKVTDEVFWRGVPESIFDESRHVFRLTTVEENKQNIENIIKLIRLVNATAPIILTLSPVPLKATFREVSCVAADCVSKSILRVALDVVMAEQHRSVYYWPSFEIVKWGGAHYKWPAYGEDDGHVRHVNQSLVVEIISAFVNAFYHTDSVSLFKIRLNELKCKKYASQSCI